MLKRVKIQGYKSLTDVEVQLQPLSVLFGPNASGKSNFLDALQLLSRIANSQTLNEAFDPPYRGTSLESFTFGPNGIQGLLAQEKAFFSIEVDIELSQVVIQAVNRQIQETGDIEKGSPLHEKYLRYRIEIETVPKAGILRVLHESLTALNAEGTLKKQAPLLLLEYRENRSHRQYMEGQRPAIFDHYLDYSILSKRYNPYFHSHLVAMREELAGWLFLYLEPRERMRTPTPVKEVRHIGLMGEELDAFLNTLRAVNEPQFSAIEKALHMVVRSITGIDVSVNNYGLIELRLMQEQMPIPVSVVSEGTLRVLGLLALTGIKERPTLLGIEEPENGVHPGRLDLIASFLETRARRNTQVIVSTHSPVLVDLIPRQSLYVCRKVGGRTQIEPFSVWEYPEVNKALDEEGPESLERVVSERILRGDFDA